MRQLLPTFKAQEQRFLKAEQDELKGRGTGLPGTGKVSAAYGSTASQLNTLNGEIERALAHAASIEREIGEIGEIVRRANNLVHLRSPISESAEAVSSEAARLDEKLAELAQLDLSPAMLTKLKFLESRIPEPGPARNKIEEAQNAQIEIIRKVFMPVAYMIELAELFGVDVAHLAGLLALISPGWLGRFQGAQLAQSEALEHAARQLMHVRLRRHEREMPLIFELPLPTFDQIDWKVLAGGENRKTPASDFLFDLLTSDANDVSLSRRP